MRGLLGRAALGAGEGLLIRPTSAIHTFFMRFAIDVVFLDRDGVVLEVVPGLRPWRLAAKRGARSVLELPAGEADARRIWPGDRLDIFGGDRGVA
jgi:uncharacterized membrane protein (UPF0127 family)